MSKLTVTYEAASMEDLAQGLEARAEELEQQVGSSNVRKGQLLKAEADGIRQAADIVRRTTIKPE
jgi:hypothetical protein